MAKDTLHIDQLRQDEQNARKHNERNLGMIQDSLREVGAARSIVIDEENNILAGNGTVQAASMLGLKSVRVVEADGEEIIAVRRTGLSAAQKTKLALYDNRAAELAEWDVEALTMLSNKGIDMHGFWNDVEFSALFLLPVDKGEDAATPISLAERFLYSPFTILDARTGEWQKQKQKWFDIGIVSEEGREENITFSRSSQPPRLYTLKNALRKKLQREPTWDEVHVEAQKQGLKPLSGTSIFDPFLCEILYTWFCPENGNILDPFAGGSVRGIVAGCLGYDYEGFDIREEQVSANVKQSAQIKIQNNVIPTWIHGDCREKLLKDDKAFDFVFSCPPYFDCEVYSDLENDLSNQSWEDFQRNYAEIIAKCCERLQNNRFACFVVGDIRDKHGHYRNLPAFTTECFQKAGLHLYNEAVLITQYGSLPIRVGGQFEKSLKLGKTHQNVLVYVKGDAKKSSVVNEQ